jgi:hypothetical protein
MSPYHTNILTKYFNIYIYIALVFRYKIDIGLSSYLLESKWIEWNGTQNDFAQVYSPLLSNHSYRLPLSDSLKFIDYCLDGRISAKQWNSVTEVVACSSWAALPEDPPTIIASDEPGIAAFHIAEIVALSIKSARIRSASRSRDGADESDEGGESDNDETMHINVLFGFMQERL